MSWVKLDDSFPDHPKVEAITDKALRVHIRGLCYCARLLTDGLIPATVADRWGKGRARELVKAGLWLDAPGGYQIHDFLVYNRSREDVLGERTSAKVRRNVGRRSAARGNGTGEGLEVEGGSGGEAAFDAFWTAYPRKVGKPNARRAFDSAMARAPAETITAGAERYRDDPNRDRAYTAHPTTWLNRDGWDDEALPDRPRANAPYEPPNPADAAARQRQIERSM